MNIFRNLIRWIMVDRPGKLLQVHHFGGGVVSRVENLEPQGVHFAPPAGAQGIGLSPGGVSSELVTVAVSGTKPDVALNVGEGGLHLLGVYKVFLSDDGKVRIGAADDAAARASRVDAEILALRNTVNALVTAYNGHTHITTATIGAGATPGVISPTVSTAAPPASPTTVASEDVLIS